MNGAAMFCCTRCRRREIVFAPFHFEENSVFCVLVSYGTAGRKQSSLCVRPISEAVFTLAGTSFTGWAEQSKEEPHAEVMAACFTFFPLGSLPLAANSRAFLILKPGVEVNTQPSTMLSVPERSTFLFTLSRLRQHSC